MYDLDPLFLPKTRDTAQRSSVAMAALAHEEQEYRTGAAQVLANAQSLLAQEEEKIDPIEKEHLQTYVKFTKAILKDDHRRRPKTTSTRQFKLLVDLFLRHDSSRFLPYRVRTFLLLSPETFLSEEEA